MPELARLFLEAVFRAGAPRASTTNAGQSGGTGDGPPEPGPAHVACVATTGGVAAETETLQSTLAAALARARAAWPDLALADAAFIDHLARSAARFADPVAALGDLHAVDLYLARACVDGAPGAVAAFERRHRPAVERALSRMGGGAAHAPEICQAMLASLLVGTEARPPRIADYQGRSPLDRWLGITAQRLALNASQADRARRRLVDRLIDEPLPPARDAEESLTRERYKPVVEAALRDALKTLSDRERVIMRLNLVGGLSTVRIAKMYGVNQATISRWLARARTAVWMATERQLRAEAPMLAGELEALLRTLASQIDLSLSTVLGGGDAPAPIRRP